MKNKTAYIIACSLAGSAAASTIIAYAKTKTRLDNLEDALSSFSDIQADVRTIGNQVDVAIGMANDNKTAVDTCKEMVRAILAGIEAEKTERKAAKKAKKAEKKSAKAKGKIDKKVDKAVKSIELKDAGEAEESFDATVKKDLEELTKSIAESFEEDSGTPDTTAE